MREDFISNHNFIFDLQKSHKLKTDKSVRNRMDSDRPYKGQSIETRGKKKYMEYNSTNLRVGPRTRDQMVNYRDISREYY
mmetsp:Transcript_6781/g.6021  ORF Transcript_6781/g.6021 Transcript_6781/m.6021 type:complete len:80 (+) Transcript_6781:2683-2922(+)